MNKKQKEVEMAKLEAEAKELKHLKAIYNKAADDITKKLEISNGKINVLLADFDNLDDKEKSVLQSQIYQRNFQLSLKKQIDSFLNELNSKQYTSVDEYLKTCYETGFVGSVYDLHGQGIPLIMPIDQKQVAAAIKLDPKISKNLYTKLGEDVNFLKKRIANNVSRGIATASEYKVIARNIAADSNMGFNRAMRIARTEGHRIQVSAANDAQHAAKEAGADIVKQWNAALDGRTRTTHRKLDGQIRDLDKPFEVDGMEAMYPSAFGIPSEDINCRCALLQRAKWNLDNDELQTLKDRAAYFGLDKTENFEDFKKKYLKITSNSLTMPEQKAIYDYMSPKSYVVNDKLRRNMKLELEETEFIANLDLALGKMPKYKGNLSRSLNFINQDAQKAFLASHAVKSTVKYNEYLSTTKGEMYDPNGQVQMYIMDSKNGNDISEFNGGEQEVLYNRNSEFLIVDRYEQDGVYYFLLREKDNKNE